MNTTTVQEGGPSGFERIRLKSRMLGLFVTSMPRILLHELINIGDYSPEREEKDTVLEDSLNVKAAKYILEKEIGTTDYQAVVADRLQEIKERRDLPQTTLVSEM